MCTEPPAPPHELEFMGGGLKLVEIHGTLHQQPQSSTHGSRLLPYLDLELFRLNLQPPPSHLLEFAASRDGQFHLQDHLCSGRIPRVHTVVDDEASQRLHFGRRRDALRDVPDGKCTASRHSGERLEREVALRLRTPLHRLGLPCLAASNLRAAPNALHLLARVW